MPHRSPITSRRTIMRMTGIIFSDLGQAASFMAIEWVQAALKQRLGFAPFPATLNVRPKDRADTQMWQRVQEESTGMSLASTADGFCSARLYPIELLGQDTADKLPGAILLPEVPNYPKDKIEIIAPVRVKEYFNICDGDPLAWEFLN